MKKGLKIIFSVVGVGLFLFSIMLFILLNGMDQAQTIQISQIDLSKTDDGIYLGKYETARWSNTIEVTIMDHKITKIKVLDDVLIPMDGLSERLYNSIIYNQSLDVDIETGTTITSKAYLKAIENALEERK